MSAKLETMDAEGLSFLHTMNWMLEVWRDKIQVLGLDIENQGFQLYGKLEDTSDFKEVLNNILTKMNKEE